MSVMLGAQPNKRLMFFQFHPCRVAFLQDMLFTADLAEVVVDTNDDLLDFKDIMNTFR